MRITRKQPHIIFVVVAICQLNFICCNSSRSLLSSISSYFNNQEDDSDTNSSSNNGNDISCEKVEDINPPEDIEENTEQDIEEHDVDVIEFFESLEDIDEESDEFDDMSDEELIDVCKRFGYHHKPNPTREELTLAAQICLIHDERYHNIQKSDVLGIEGTKIAQQMISEKIDEALENDAIVDSLYLDYLKMMT